MQNWWNAFRQVFKRELKIIAGDKDILLIILLSPLFYAFFYGSVYLHKTEANVPLAVVDRDHSALSRTLVRSLDAHQLLAVEGSYPDMQSARKALENWQVQGIVYIPDQFQDELKQRKGAGINVYVNGSKFLIANDINKAVNEVAATIDAGVKWRYLEAGGLHPEQAKELVEPLRGEIRPLFNFTESYGDFLLPGLLALILQQTLLIGLAESTAREREKGKLGEWFSAAGKRKMAALAGKIAFYGLLFAAYALLFFTLHFHLFKLPFKGSRLAVAVLTLLYLSAMSLASVFVGSFFRSKLDALLILVFTSYPLFLLSGYSWPLQSMPWVLRGLSQLLPSTPFLLAVDRVSLMGANFAQLLPEMAHLLLLILFWGGMAWQRFGRTYFRLGAIPN